MSGVDRFVLRTNGSTIELCGSRSETFTSIFDVAGMGLVPERPMMQERPIMVCLHGGPGFDHPTLKTSLAPLADVAQLVFPDQRGAGRSDRGTSDRWDPVDRGRTRLLQCTGDRAADPARPFLWRHRGSWCGCPPSRATGKADRLEQRRPNSSGPGARDVPTPWRWAAREVAARFFESPTQESLASYRGTCLPLYNPSPADPDVFAARYCARISPSTSRETRSSASTCSPRWGRFVVRR